MDRLVHPPKARPGDRVPVPSPTYADPAVGTAVHEQAMKRLTEATGLVPVDFLLVLETSEELIPANAFRHLIRVLGEREY